MALDEGHLAIASSAPYSFHPVTRFLIPAWHTPSQLDDVVTRLSVLTEGNEAWEREGRQTQDRPGEREAAGGAWATPSRSSLVELASPPRSANAGKETSKKV